MAGGGPHYTRSMRTYLVIISGEENWRQMEGN